MRAFILATSQALLLFMLSGTAQATQWESEMIKGNAKSSRCLEQAAAEQEAKKQVAESAKDLCRAKSYGWHLEEVKGEGQLSCIPCGDDKAQCQVNDLSLECRRLKPGSVGMGMIPFFGSATDD